MGRLRKADTERRVQVNAGMPPDLAAEIDAIAVTHFLTRVRAAELLLTRGLLAYQRDGLLLDASVGAEEVEVILDTRKPRITKAK